MVTSEIHLNKKICLERLDRLSDLPEDVVDKILTNLPLRNAVRTSALSKSWRYKWATISNLIFNALSIPPSLSKLTSMEGQTNTIYTEIQRITQLASVVSHVLLLHKGTIFRFQVQNYLSFGCTDVDKWIPLLEKKLVQELVLLFGIGIPYKLSSSLFSCQNLKILKLRNCELNLQSQSKGFNNLTELVLVRVFLTDEAIANLLINSPLLQKIYLVSCQGFTVLRINAPNLRFFKIIRCCREFNFENTLNLRAAYIKMLCPNTKGLHHKTQRLEEFFAALINVYYLDLDKNFMEVLAVYLIPERLSFLCNLISIKVSIYFEDRNEILTALCLLGSSPRLQKIYIRSYNKKKRPHLDKEFWEGQRFRAISLPKLRSVNLESYRGRESESGFVEFLLKNAPFLVTLDIKWSPKFQGSTRSICEGEIMQFMRSSERATITFL